MYNIQRNLTPVQRKPRSPKTITKKLRKPTNKKPKETMWANSDIPQSYTKV